MPISQNSLDLDRVERRHDSVSLNTRSGGAGSFDIDRLKQPATVHRPVQSRGGVLLRSGRRPAHALADPLQLVSGAPARAVGLLAELVALSAGGGAVAMPGGLSEACRSGAKPARHASDAPL